MARHVILNFLKIKPRWQHKEPAVRRRAIQALSDRDLAALAQILREEPEPDLRRLALERLHDLPTLAAAMRNDRDAGVREVAQARLRAVLAGESSGDSAPSLAERLALIEQSADVDLAEYLAQHARDVEIREAVLPRVVQDDVLAEVAVNDRSVALRLAAVERIQDPGALERVFKESRKKDKQVSRRARERLDALIEVRERPARLIADAERICERLEGLGRGRQWEQDDATLRHLSDQWTTMLAEGGGVISGGLEQRFAAAKDAYVTAAADAQRERQAQKEASEHLLALRGERERLLAALEGLQQEALGSAEDEDTVEGLRARLPELRGQWEAMEDLPAVMHEAFQYRFGKLFDEASRVLELKAERRRARILAEDAIARLERLLRQRRPLEAREAQSLARDVRKKVASLPADDARKAIEERRQALQTELDQRLEALRQQRQDRLDKLPKWLKELEDQIEAGNSKASTTLHDRIQSALQLLDATGGAGPEGHAFEQTLKQILPRLHKLQEWRDWAVVNERERLCREMEDLIGQSIHPTTLADQIHALQQEWKRLDSTRAPASQALWERFKGAADRAYEPVRVYRGEQAEERQRNREAREIFVAELTAYLDAVEWSHADWRALVVKERDARRQWRELGPVDHKQRRALDEAFQAQMQRLTARLREERGRGLQERRNLIAQIQGLAGAEDIARAIDETRRLQRQWQVTVPAARREENELWQAFRAASDGVFQRRRQDAAAREQAERESLEHREALCVAIESLRPAEAVGLGEARQRLHGLQGEWQAAGPVPRREASAIERRYESAVKAFERHAEQLLANEQRAELDRLRDRAAICLALERLVEAGPVDEAGILDQEARWQSAGTLSSARQEQALQERFARALAAAKGDAEQRRRLLQARETHLVRRQQLCLQMEILAGVESPPEAREARLTYQVNRLARAMSQGQHDPTRETEDLERDWYLSGFAGSPADGALESRFQRALAAIGARDQPASTQDDPSRGVVSQ